MIIPIQKVFFFVANMTYENFGVGVIESKVDNKTGDDPFLLTTCGLPNDRLDSNNECIT